MNKNEPKIFILLPAFNEEKNLEGLIPQIFWVLSRMGTSFEIVTVDDGSTDNTKTLLKDFKTTLPEITPIFHNVNQGLGAALKTGFEYVSSVSSKDDILISLDSDSSHPPATIVQLAQKIFEGNEIVIASRYQKGSRVRGVPFFRQALSLFARFLFQLRYPIKAVKDYTCGFRAYRMELIQKGYQRFGATFINKTGFEVMADILIKLRSFDPICAEVPLVLRYDQKIGDSKMKVYKTIKKTLQLVFRQSPASP